MFTTQVHVFIIFNSELTNNSADSNGGAIYVRSGNVCISESQLTNNGAEKRNGETIAVIVVINSSLIIKKTNSKGHVNAFNSRVELNGRTTLSNNRGGVFGGAISCPESNIH